jgi:hypothetical protein
MTDLWVPESQRTFTRLLILADEADEVATPSELVDLGIAPWGRVPRS